MNNLRFKGLLKLAKKHYKIILLALAIIALLFPMYISIWHCNVLLNAMPDNHISIKELKEYDHWNQIKEASSLLFFFGLVLNFVTIREATKKRASSQKE